MAIEITYLVKFTQALQACHLRLNLELLETNHALRQPFSSFSNTILLSRKICDHPCCPPSLTARSFNAVLETAAFSPLGRTIADNPARTYRICYDCRINCGTRRWMSRTGGRGREMLLDTLIDVTFACGLGAVKAFRWQGTMADGTFVFFT